MRLGKCRAVIVALIAALSIVLLTGCLGPREPGPPASRHGPSQASQPATSRPTAASEPATTTQPSAATQPNQPIVRPPAPVAPEGSTSEALLPRDMPAHPFLMFDKAELAGIAKRKGQDPLLQECWDKMAELAGETDQLDEWWEQLEARALIAVASDDKAMARKAIALMQAGLKKTDPDQFYEIGAANFQLHAAPLRALALAWDWLYGYMTAQQRTAILPQLERWCRSCLVSTNKRAWRDADDYVGAIPIGGLGILALAIHADSAHPDANLWLREATRRIGQNYLPTCWKPSGICGEGPNYAIVGLKYPALFAEALRRCGGQDMVGSAGATLASEYLMYQWMPQEGCAPIGDNTGFGRRTFAAEYLLGIARTKDPVALWTWRNSLDSRYLDPLIAYLWYPLAVRPTGPVAAQTPAGKYFEVTPNRAGYFFSRTKWQDPDAAFFAFVTRYERCNHQHYDMDSFLLGAYGTAFATHEMLFPQGHANHGVDFEHNMIVVDDGGWPRHDNDASCADDNSTLGLLMGLASGPFADYVRGDARWSYRDNSVPTDSPAIRAERSCLFVKAGATPYLLVFDDIQFSDDEHIYKWLWHAPLGLTMTGKGTAGDPLVLAAKKGSSAIHFLVPQAPAVSIEKARNLAGKQPARDLSRIVVSQKGIRVRYVAVATLQETRDAQPVITAQPVACESDSAGAARVRLADGYVDLVAWQSEEMGPQRGSPLATGPLQTDGLVAMVRIKGEQVVGYVLGEGTYLRYGQTLLVQAAGSVCVTASTDGVKVSGRRQAREGLPTLEPGEVKTYSVPK